LQHFESQIVVCIADAHTVRLGDQLTSDGRWRLILLAGKLTQQAQRSRYEKLYVELVSTRSPVIQYHVGQDVDNFIEILTVVSSERSAIDLTEYPDIARPACGPHKYRKYNIIFADEVSYHDDGGQAYQGYGVDPEGLGVAVLIRVSPVFKFARMICTYCNVLRSPINMLQISCHLILACLDCVSPVPIQLGIFCLPNVLYSCVFYSVH
jgi:Phenol hydroxylase, C-terminal dimerisation domain